MSYHSDFEGIMGIIDRVMDRQEWAEGKLRALEDKLKGLQDTVRQTAILARDLEFNQRYLLETLFQTQEAFFAYVHHDKNAEDVKKILNSFLDMVQDRLREQPKLIKLIEKSNMKAMEDLDWLQLEWILSETEKRISLINDDDSQKAKKLTTLRKDVWNLIRKKREEWWG